MKEKLVKILYDFWSKNDDNKEKLLKEIIENINNGANGAECLLDWCRCDFEGLQDKYRISHNLSIEEISKMLEENDGSYEFMYDELPYAKELDKIWDICNWYLDYCNGITTEKQLLEFIEEK